MRIRYWTKVMKYGNSHIIVIPKDVRIACEIEERDFVMVDIQRWDHEPNLHVDWPAREDPETRDNGMDQESGYPQMDSCEGDR